MVSDILALEDELKPAALTLVAVFCLCKGLDYKGLTPLTLGVERSRSLSLLTYLLSVSPFINLAGSIKELS